MFEFQIFPEWMKFKKDFPLFVFEFCFDFTYNSNYG